MKKIKKTDYSKMSKKELEVFGRDYGLELDRRLKKSTLVRMIELSVEKQNKKQPTPNKSYYGKLVILTVIIAVGLLILKNCI